MTAVTVFNGLFCEAEAVIKEVAKRSGYRLVTDIDVIDAAARISGQSQETILANFPSRRGESSVARPEREQIYGALHFAMAEMLSESRDIIFWGYVALLPPLGFERLLRVCLIDEIDDRIATAARLKGYSREEARKRILADDLIRSELSLAVSDCNDPWDAGLYDLRIPVAAVGVEPCANIILHNLAKSEADSFPFTKSMDECLLESKIQAEMGSKGYKVDVDAHDDVLKVVFDNHQNVLQAMCRQLIEAASSFDGVKGVEVGTGGRYNPNDIYQRLPVLGVNGPVGSDEPACAGFHGCHGEDAILAEQIENSLVSQGLDVTVASTHGRVSVTLNDHRSMLQVLSRELGDFVCASHGIKDVEVGVGKTYGQVDGYIQMRRSCCESAVVNDEREFELVVSDRMRQPQNVGGLATPAKPVARKSTQPAARPVSGARRAYSYR